MKYLRVHMPDGTIWEVEAGHIAIDRAKYYEKLEPGCYHGEYLFTLEDEDELLDWAQNNMNWSDVEEHAKMVGRDEESSNYQEGWVNGKREVVQR